MTKRQPYCLVYRHKCKLSALTTVLALMLLDRPISLLATLLLSISALMYGHNLDGKSNHRRMAGDGFNRNELKLGRSDDPAHLILLIFISLSAASTSLSSIVSVNAYTQTCLNASYYASLFFAAFIFVEYQNRWIKCHIIIETSEKIRYSPFKRVAKIFLLLFGMLLTIIFLIFGGALIYDNDKVGFFIFSMGALLLFSITLNTMSTILAMKINASKDISS